MNDMTFVRFILWTYASCLFVNAVMTKIAFEETLSYQAVASIWLGAALIWYGPLKTRMEPRFQ